MLRGHITGGFKHRKAVSL